MIDLINGYREREENLLPSSSLNPLSFPPSSFSPINALKVRCGSLVHCSFIYKVHLRLILYLLIPAVLALIRLCVAYRRLSLRRLTINSLRNTVPQLFRFLYLLGIKFFKFFLELSIQFLLQGSIRCLLLPFVPGYQDNQDLGFQIQPEREQARFQRRCYSKH